MINVTNKDLKVGNKVYVKSLGAFATIGNIRKNKDEVEVFIGNIKTVVKIKDLYNSEQPKEKNETVKIYKSMNAVLPKSEINVVGKTSLEALTEVENFIDQAIVNGLEEVKIIHGVGEGILLKEIRNYLKTVKSVLEFRRGKYGEGENGVTIVTLK